MEIKKRYPIEGTGAELVYHHGLRRACYWGRLKLSSRLCLPHLRWISRDGHSIRLAGLKPAKIGPAV